MWKKMKMKLKHKNARSGRSVRSGNIVYLWKNTTGQRSNDFFRLVMSLHTSSHLTSGAFASDTNYM